MGRRLADLFHGRPRLQVGTLLAGPIGWLVVGYLGSLAVLLVAAFWRSTRSAARSSRTSRSTTSSTLLEEPVYRTIAGRTIAIAALVTLTDALLAFPIAFYMAKVASDADEGAARGRDADAALVELPGQGLRLADDALDGGVINWALDPIGASGPGYGNVAVWLVMSYLWLPFMIIPIYAGLERIPDSLLSASEDLGATPSTTFRRVILPLVFPAVVAGSIFTFSLTLGDYITPSLVSNNQFIGNVVYTNITNNLPLASAFMMVPVVVMIIYLLVARRLGAFEHL